MTYFTLLIVCVISAAAIALTELAREVAAAVKGQTKV